MGRVRVHMFMSSLQVASRILASHVIRDPVGYGKGATMSSYNHLPPNGTATQLEPLASGRIKYDIWSVTRRNSELYTRIINEILAYISC